MTEKEYASRPNKTQIKKEIRVLNDLGKELIKMPDGAVKRVPLSDTMRSAIADGKRFSRGALQRQLRRIASLMQHEDVAAIESEIQRQKQPGKQHTAELHQLEQWRDRLIADDDKLLCELIDQFETIDRQYLRQLVRNAKQELLHSKPPKSARRLFKYLSEIKKQTPGSDKNIEKLAETSAASDADKQTLDTDGAK